MGTGPVRFPHWDECQRVGTELWKNVINCRSQPQKFSGNPPERHSCRMLDFKVITTRNLSPSQAHPFFFVNSCWIPIDSPWWITESLDTHSPIPLSYPGVNHSWWVFKPSYPHFPYPKRWPTMAHIPMIIPSKIAMMWFDYHPHSYDMMFAYIPSCWVFIWKKSPLVW